MCTAIAGCGKGEVTLANHNKAHVATTFAPTPSLPLSTFSALNQHTKGYAGFEKNFNSAGI
jgi:hypothetical protein